MEQSIRFFLCPNGSFLNEKAAVSVAFFVSERHNERRLKKVMFFSAVSNISIHVRDPPFLYATVAAEAVAFRMAACRLVVIEERKSNT